MPSIDERIVEMRFNRSDFNKGVAETLDGIKSLDNTLSGAGGIADNVDKVSGRLGALGALGFTAIQRLGNAAMDAGSKIVTNIMDPIFEGGSKRALNIEQAKFQFEGLGMDVEASMASALKAVKGTAYGLDEAAVVAAQFGASGMKAGDEMTEALLGISGVAAMSGSAYADVGNVFTKVAGQGRLMGQDLLSLSSRGVNAAATVRDYFQEVQGQSEMTEAKVREMVTSGDISFETFAAAMSHAFGEHATKANETYTGSLSNMRAALARIGAEFQTAKFEKHRRMFNALTPVIDEVFTALEPLMKVYERFAEMAAEKFEARMLNILENFNWESLRKIIQNISRGVLNLKIAFQTFIAPITAAWKEVFKTNKEGGGLLKILERLTSGFQKFTFGLKRTKKSQESIQRGFETFFRTIKMGLKPFEWIKYALDNLHVAFIVVGEYLARIVPSWGQNLIDFGLLAESLGGGVSGTFKAMVDRLKDLGGTIKEFYESFKSGESSMDSFADKATAAVDRVKSALQWLYDTGRAIVKEFTDVWAMLGDALDGTMGSLGKNSGAFEKILHALSPILAGIRDTIAGALEAIGKAFRDEDPLVLFMGLQTILSNIIGLNLSSGFKKLAGGIGAGFEDAGRGIGEFLRNINEPVEQTKTTKIFLLAASIAALAGSLMMISKVPQDRMMDSAAALAAMAGVLLGSMMAINKFITAKDVASLPAMAAGLVLFSAAIFVMSAGLEKIGSIPADNLWNAVGAITALTIVMTVMATALETTKPKNIFGAALAMIVMAGALAVLSIAVTALGALPLETLVQGGVAVAAMLAGMVAAAVILNKYADDMVLSAVGLMAMALALNMMVVPITTLGFLPFEALEQGMLNLALVLGGLVLAAIVLNEFAEDMILSAVGLVAMALALNMMIPPILILGFLPYDVLVQGLVAVGVALLALVVAASLMQSSAVGALALIAIAAAMVVLAVAIGMLAALPYEAAWGGLTLMAAGLVTMVAAAMVGQMVLPGLLGLAALVAAFGLAAMAMGAAVMLGAIGLTMFGAALPVLAAGLALFGSQATRILVAIPILVALGAAMVPLTVVTAVLGVGIMLMGVGLALLSASLLLLSVTAPAGTLALVAFFTALLDLGLRQMAKLAVLAAEFAVLGAALLVLGAGLVLTAAGAIAAAAGLALLAGGGALAVMVGNKIKTAFSGMEPVIANIAAMAVAFRALGVSMSGLYGIANNLLSSLSRITPTLAAVAAGILLLTTVSSSTSSAVTSSFMEMAAGMTIASLLIKATANSIVDSVRGLSTGVTGVAPLAGIAITVMINMMVEALMGGRVRIVTSIGLIVTSFALLAAQLTTISRPSAAAVRSMITQVVRELAKGATLVPRAITVLSNAVGRLPVGINQNRTKAVTATRNMVDGVRSALTVYAGSVYSRAYSVGVSVSAGMANGIRAGGGNVAAAARTVALTSMNSAKSALGVASPSKRFFEIAGFVVDGFVNGLSNGERIVGKASEDLGDESVESMRDVIDKIFEEMGSMSDMDLSPVITPVLNLDEMKGQISEMGGMFGPASLNVGYSRSQAGSIATLENAVRSALESASKDEPKGDTFIQNNYSPEALSPATIYRQTRNQISSAKNQGRRRG